MSSAGEIVNMQTWYIIFLHPVNSLPRQTNDIKCHNTFMSMTQWVKHIKLRAVTY